jgi:hypothetical protein
MSTVSTEPLSFGQIVFRIGQNVRNLNGSTLKQYPAGNARSSWLKSQALHVLYKFGRQAVACSRIVLFCRRRLKNLSGIRFAYPSDRIYECLQDRWQVEGGATYDFENLCCRGLLLERFP